MLGLAYPYCNYCRTLKKADATFISYINLFVIKGSQAFIQIFKVHLPIASSASKGSESSEK